MKHKAKSPHQLFYRHINPAIRLLIFSDIMVAGSAAMLSPLFALYVEGFIQEGTALVVSVATGIYLVSRSLLQIPIATIIDKIKGESDDYYLLVAFTFIMSFLPLLYLIIQTPTQLYLVQILMGLATAITYPSYMAIFTRHIDQSHEGTEWGIYFTSTDLGSATLAIIGGYLAQYYGFPTLILTLVLVSFVGSLILTPIRTYLKST